MKTKIYRCPKCKWSGDMYEAKLKMGLNQKRYRYCCPRCDKELKIENTERRNGEGKEKDWYERYF